MNACIALHSLLEKCIPASNSTLHFRFSFLLQLNFARQQFFVEKLELPFFASNFKDSKKGVKIDGSKIQFYGSYGQVNPKMLTEPRWVLDGPPLRQ